MKHHTHQEVAPTSHQRLKYSLFPDPLKKLRKQMLASDWSTRLKYKALLIGRERPFRSWNRSWFRTVIF